jgi:hypothetical protein
METQPSLAIGDDNPGPLPGNPQRNQLLLDILKNAIASAGEQRLFRAGKLSGLFPNKVGLCAEAALVALRDGLLETIRTETKGKMVTEWVRATPKAVKFIHDHDSPQSVLRELKEVLATSRLGIPSWLSEAKQEAATLSARFDERAAALLARLDDLTLRVEAALRRVETQSPKVTEGISLLIPWAVEALQYLDQRNASGATRDCPLPELFQAIRLRHPDLALPEFQNGLRRLHDLRAMKLIPCTVLNEPEYAMVIDGSLMGAVRR